MIPIPKIDDCIFSFPERPLFVCYHPVCNDEINIHGTGDTEQEAYEDMLDALSNWNEKWGSRQ